MAARCHRQPVALTWAVAHGLSYVTVVPTVGCDLGAKSRKALGYTSQKLLTPSDGRDVAGITAAFGDP